MTRTLRWLVLGCGVFISMTSGFGADRLADGFRQPGETTKPWVYWYWITDNISREGITRDLEAMRRVGIGAAFVGNIYLEDVQHGGVKALTEEWWGMVEHAIREGGRIGVDIGMFNCPGWSQSGGPWIKPEQAMRYLATSEQRVQGPGRFEGTLPLPAEPFQDVALLAFPVPPAEATGVAMRSPRVSTVPAAAGAERLVDGATGEAFMLPAGAGQGGNAFVVEIDLAEPFTARSLVLHPAQTAFAVTGELQAADGQGVFQSVRSFPVDRSNPAVGVGFRPHAPVSISFMAQTSRKYRLVFTGARGPAGFAEIELTGAARVERYMEKQLAKMHPTPLPMWETYLWPRPAEVDPAAGALVAPGDVMDLSERLGSDGILRWEVPAGEWLVVRMGMTPTGTRNAPASPEGQGLEVDKMNRAAAQAHFDAYIGELLRRMPARDRRAFKFVVADSYEMGSQNWTDGFGETFRKRYGYDPRPWLPVLTGRVVGSADESERFLWDLRRLVADHVALDYVGGLRDACRRHGLELWLENYGHWGFPAEFLQYGGQSDRVGGEFWATGDLGSIELRAAASCAHTYGKPIVSAEAFTSTLKFESTPWSLKQRGDWALTEGVNHWVLHVYIHQPWEDRLPGVNAWFSTEFNRHNPWFEPGREWINYWRRCHHLLQHGRHVADVAYFIGEDAPKMTGVRRPELPAGYNYDYINAEVIERRLKVKHGRFVLPDGMSYRVLVLPELDTMRPAVLRAIRNLVRAGGVVLGPPPARSPSLQQFPKSDVEVRKLAEDLWGSEPAAPVRRVGKGRVFTDVTLETVFEQLAIAPDVAGLDPRRVLWTHRASADADLYFLSNQGDQPAVLTPEFRVNGRLPELWDPVSGEIVQTAMFERGGAGVRVPLRLGARGSMFVVFREPAAGSDPGVVAVKRDGETLWSTRQGGMAEGPPAEGGGAVNTFTMAGWVKPGADIALPAEADRGVVIHLARNDAVWAAHGDSLFPEGGHAGAGISAGRNGICVYEHSGNYFAPLLVFAAPAPLTNWTHVAVVYETGRPTLYLDGQRVHQGLASQYRVHPSVGFGQTSPSGSFKGSAAGFEQFAQALAPAAIRELAQQRPTSAEENPLPAIRVTRGAKGLQAEVSAAGLYELTRADGASSERVVADLPGPQAVDGPWQVRFPPDRDVPEEMALDALISLTEHPSAAVRHFSGTVEYTKTFVLTRVEPDTRWHLDLGRVEGVAEISVNGCDLGVLWQPPFLRNVTEALIPGTNTLTVRVSGTWRNRLIGDARHPKSFPVEGSGGGGGALQFKPYLTANIGVRAEESLTPFGLLGPVVLRTSRMIDPWQPNR